MRNIKNCSPFTKKSLEPSNFIMKENKPSIDFSSILASCVHDMKNSLSMVINTLDNITDNDTQAHPEEIERLKYESKRVNNQLVQLLALYKIGNKQYFLNIAENNVRDFVEEALTSHVDLLKKRNITLKIDIDSELVWYFDEALIKSVINNIVNNAYQYTKNQICISAELNDNTLRLCIMDNGGGYPEKMLHKFEETKKTSINVDTGSTGLGLFFCQQVAELHKNKENFGSIELNNNGIDGGGRFILSLP